MYKNVKSKIILISVIIGLMLLGSLGFLYLTSINEIQNIINQGNDVHEITERINEIYLSAKITISIIIVIFKISKSHNWMRMSMYHNEIWIIF